MFYVLQKTSRQNRSERLKIRRIYVQKNTFSFFVFQTRLNFLFLISPELFIVSPMTRNFNSNNGIYYATQRVLKYNNLSTWLLDHQKGNNVIFFNAQRKFHCPDPANFSRTPIYRNRSFHKDGN